MSVGKSGGQSDAEEPGLRGLSGLELQHDLYLAIRDTEVWPAVADVFRRAGAALHSLQFQRHAEGCSVRCRLKQLSSDRARDLAATLIESGLARQAHVEHLMLTKAATERAP